MQAAVMAPTEILAEQHYRKFSEWLAPLGVQLTWLSGSQKKKERAAAAADIAAGATRVAVGTHALFQEGVVFQSLGLAIVDEQHRFGVEQRLALRAKGLGSQSAGADGGASAEPHQLMMSATPIPRTLSMSYYADLDVSVIDELPPGRTPVTTKLIAAERRDEVLARVREACRAGAPGLLGLPADRGQAMPRRRRGRCRCKGGARAAGRRRRCSCRPCSTPTRASPPNSPISGSAWCTAAWQARTRPR